MTWLFMVVLAGIAMAVGLWAAFVYIAVRGMKTEIPDESFGAALAQSGSDGSSSVRLLLAIDGSPASVAAVREVAHCPLPGGSIIQLLYVVHSRLPVIPDFPPWAVTIAAAHGESIREQTRRAPAVLEAAAAYLRARQLRCAVISKVVEGAPKDEIVREARAWGADRIVLGSHGRSRRQRVVLGATAPGVAAEAPCTVQVVRQQPARPPQAQAESVVSAG